MGAPHVPALLAVGFLGRLPHSVTAVLVTMHVTSTMGLDYASSGLAAAVLTIGVAIGSPWRGRRIDMVGLRRAILPSVIVEGLAWCLAPYANFPVLVLLLFLAGLYSIPVFTVVRQSLGVLMKGPDRRTAFSLDSMATELVFVIGPGGSAVLAAAVSTKAALTTVGVLVVLAGIALMASNPPTRSPDLPEEVATGPIDELQAPGRAADAPEVVPTVTGAMPIIRPDSPGPRKRTSWVTPGVVAMFIMSAGAGLSLSGTEVGVVAFSELFDDHGTGLWWAYGLWCFASLSGGFVYGLMSRRLDPLLLLTLMGVALIPAVFAGNLFWLGIALFPSGFFCAPLMTASSERITDLVEERHRGVAMGVYGSAMTAGTALGTPIVGVVIDSGGPGTAFMALAVVTMAVGLATIGLRTLRRRNRRR
jgi:MFS family permease